MKTIGLGMTVYNRERYLAGAIESVLRQSLTDWELHIVDDCSTDRSLEIAQDYAAWHPRIKVYAQRPNRGFGYSLRSALAQCNTQYLGWLDSDDELMPNALETMVKYLNEHPGAGMAYSQYSTMDLNGSDTGIGYRCEIPYSPDRLLVDFMVFHLHVIRSDAYHRLGGIDPELKDTVDYDFCLRASEAMEIRSVPEILYRYRQHADSMSVKDRITQIKYSKDAIERALVRRGMSETHRLEIKTRFRLEQIHAG
jgi:glycosyltransferase involved in cell wall biosynthesis